MTTEVIECTREHPWDEKQFPNARVRHRDAREVGEQEDGWPGGDWVTYECPNCRHKWRAELPQ